ncbi:MAG: hypothetical protein K1X68_13610 [Saprospiraceae bacterium]|nr:hypothetical protein [Saprospiraceae bacterium]HMW39288.1 hypothetical protein [Saprospiraceae bacterium]HMX89078.1 hypothetical protein [Saprospiraceae bacterium]HMZ40949.1 hypothetical protein [Saprospiraceae bacterium]HNC36788.1 hypothetical protein [Saprospiraceae bacterium]
MTKTYIIYQKGVAYSDKIYSFIDSVENRIPESERTYFDIGASGEKAGALYNELKSQFNFQSKYLTSSADTKGRVSWKLTKQPVIIQFESKFGGTYSARELDITDEYITGNTLNAAFLDKLYPVNSGNPTNPGTNPTSLEKPNTTLWIVGGLVVAFLLFRK